MVEHDPAGPLIMLGEGGGVAGRGPAAVALPPLNMNLARYLVIQAIKNKKIRGRSALRLLDIAGLSQLLVQVSNLIVDCPEIQRLDIHPCSPPATSLRRWTLPWVVLSAATVKAVSLFVPIRTNWRSGW